jgi:hypothetical protein
MAKKVINEAEMMARMAGGNFQQKIVDSDGDNVKHFMQVHKQRIEDDGFSEQVMTQCSQPQNSEEPKKEEKVEIEVTNDTKGSRSNERKNVYEEKFLSRNIYDTFRKNVGISKETLDIAERVVARIFDNKIAVSTYVDNVLLEHFTKYKKDFETWLVERPVTIF